MTQHRIPSRALYALRFGMRRVVLPPALPGISVLLLTWNRARFLDECLRALADTLPEEHELLVWDNASQDETREVVRQWRASRLRMHAFRARRNIGTSGYARLALHARCEWLVEMDDDVLALPPHWHEKMIAAFRAFPDLGYLALDVVQDEFTTGAKPSPDHYVEETRAGSTVHFGPTGGWCAMTPRDVYWRVGGFPFRPHKPFFAEDGYYCRQIERHGLRHGILAGVRCYHAAGPAWNAAFGYAPLLAEKYASPGAPAGDFLAAPPLAAPLPDLSVIERHRIAS